MKRTLLVVLALIIVVALIWLGLGHKKKAATTTTPPPQRTAAVSISAAGFSPATLSVKAGTKVTWTNLDQKNNHRVKANPYPTGDSLPGLDSKVNMPPTSTYSYTFSSPGTYKYHDQLNPLLNGEVVVTQ